jgi:hypothetical protein
MNQVTTGFTDAIANRLASIAALALVKGTNLFGESVFDQPDLIQDHTIIADGGYDPLPDFGHVHVNWDIVISTARKVRTDALDALRPIINELVTRRTFVATSDANESFRILIVRVISAPELAGKLGSGNYLAQATVQFQTIPF